MDNDDSDSDTSIQDVYTKIIEQPARLVRFRYECETRYPANIPGRNSSLENKTFPTIQVAGYKGKAVVVVSCVTKDPPYIPHPHNLVGRDCSLGVCTTHFPTDTMTVVFDNIGIQCAKKKDIEQSLRVRQQVRVDPFRTGFHENSALIDINVVRLAFQVFLQDVRSGKYSIILPPIVSDPIFESKSLVDLSIVKMSHCVSSVEGGMEDIIILCDRVPKRDILVRFFEENSEWETYVEPSQVFKQRALWFKPPKYKHAEVTEPVKVFIQLQRYSDGATGDPLPFELLPSDEDSNLRDRKRRKIMNIHEVIEQLKEYDTTGRLTGNFPSETSFLTKLILPDISEVPVSPFHVPLQASVFIPGPTEDIRWNIPLSEPEGSNNSRSVQEPLLLNEQEVVELGDFGDLMVFNSDGLYDFFKVDSTIKDSNNSFVFEDLVMSDSFTKLSINDESTAQ